MICNWFSHFSVFSNLLTARIKEQKGKLRCSRKLDTVELSINNIPERLLCARHYTNVFLCIISTLWGGFFDRPLFTETKPEVQDHMAMVAALWARNLALWLELNSFLLPPWSQGREAGLQKSLSLSLTVLTELH